MINNPNFDYRPHLKAAYIDPIRTVIVIDDEYPTIDDLIVTGKDNFEPENIERLEQIIKVSRSRDYNWLLDVYNGKEEKVQEGIVSNRLHHSDLLILDYHLDGEDSGYCKKSIDIIKNLSSNRNFNIVAVHTKGYNGDKGSVQDVLIDIIISLQERPQLSIIADSKMEKKINDALDDWEIDEPGIKDKILESISTIDLLHLISKYKNSICKRDFSHPLLTIFSNIYNDRSTEIDLPKPWLLKWLCSEKLNSYNQQFSESPPKYFEWGMEDGSNWIRTEDLFLTVLGKKDTPIHEIPNQLLEAMAQSRPHPHKLILSKLRQEIERNGSFAASNILNKKYLQAAWLKELISKPNDDIAVKTAAWHAVTKLWEELAYEIKPNIDQFTINLVNSLKKMESPLNYFIEKETLDNEAEQIIHANCFSCSKKISTHHLVTGHILKFQNNFWLCLTPMCDLVPGQKKDIDELLPVTLVQMYDAKAALKSTRASMQKSLSIEEIPILNGEDEIKKILDHATQNNLLFIRPEGENNKIVILSFTVGLDGKANPKAKDFYVENQGIFEENTRTLKLKYAEIGRGVEIKEVDAEIVAELRYEYALNLLGKLGVSKSRVGLDFIN
ncbi:response regulator receiver domain [Phytobacter diazotrophicus]|jgi:hypothetical protein|uniref:response regulator receiver domain n=1 Tax=Phytobacter diazotrophicus TaxID=395631 RepID=UPI0029092DC2|nr:response regulator receiver domain [Enterobacteriaceae bacterium]